MVMILASAFALVAFDGAPSLEAPRVPNEPAIYDGTPVMECQWPTMAMLGFGGCSASLVSPWIVITAAHCVGNVEDPGSIELGESVTQVSVDLPVEYCRQNPEYQPTDQDNGVNGQDISYCKLKQPIYDFPSTPIIYGSEVDEYIVEQQPAYMVGIGDDSVSGGYGIKRYAESRILSVFQPHENGAFVGSMLNGPCSGDSGGPAYVQYTDGSWHVFGVVSGGQPPCGAEGDQYAMMHPWVPWIEEDSGIDITPCHDVDGTWNPTGWCQGFELDPLDGGNWDNLCLGEVSGPSSTGGAPYDEKVDETPPTVTIVSPADETIYDTAPSDVEIVIEAEDGDGQGVRIVGFEINGMQQDFEMRMAPFEVTTPFPQGGYTLVVFAEDFAGNVGESAAVRFAVDDELPPAPVDPGDESSGTGDGTGSTGVPDPTVGETTDASESDTGGETTGAPEQDEGGGCGCSATQTTTAGLFLPLLVMFARRRRD